MVDSTLVVGIYGTISPQSSNGVSTKARLRAIKEATGLVAKYRFSDGKEKMIRLWTMDGKLCLFLESDKIGKNYLEQFPECDKMEFESATDL